MPCVRHLPRCTDCSPRPYEEVHRALARRAAEEGIILLKNENHTLPLPSGCRIALYGTGALHTLKGGTGSGDVNARETVSIRDGLYAAGFQIANEAWLQHCDTIYRQARSKWRDRVWEQLETGQQPHFFAAYVNTPFQAPACAPAKAACDAALYVLSRSSGEGADRKNEPGDYLLSKWEMQDLRSLCSFYPSVILVLNTGGIVDLSVLDELPRIHSPAWKAETPWPTCCAAPCPPAGGSPTAGRCGCRTAPVCSSLPLTPAPFGTMRGFLWDTATLTPLTYRFDLDLEMAFPTRSFPSRPAACAWNGETGPGLCWTAPCKTPGTAGAQKR